MKPFPTEMSLACALHRRPNGSEKESECIALRASAFHKWFGKCSSGVPSVSLSLWLCLSVRLSFGLIVLANSPALSGLLAVRAQALLLAACAAAVRACCCDR